MRGGENGTPLRELTFTTCDGTAPLQFCIAITDLIYQRLEPSFERVSNTFGHPLCVSVLAACYVHSSMGEGGGDKLTWGFRVEVVDRLCHKSQTMGIQP